MPIEFACEDCGSVLRVPDGTSGKRSRCPSCKHEQEIPFVVDSSDAVTPSGKLSIPCPKCQHHLVCDPELLGTRGQCKKCAHIFTISKDPAPTVDSAPALVFHCPECNQLFEGREDMRGRKGKCHVCQAVFPISLKLADSGLPADSVSPSPEPALQKTAPVSQTTAEKASSTTTEKPKTPVANESSPLQLKSAPTVPKPQLAADVNDELTILDDEPKSARTRRSERPETARAPQTAPAASGAVKPATTKSQKPIRFECAYCQGVMEVPGSTAGLETECPYCQVVLTIPEQSTVPVPASTPQPGVSHYASSQSSSTSPTSGLDTFNNLDLGDLSNPYSAPAGIWIPPTNSTLKRPSTLTVGNVLQQGFEGMFPSCLIIFLYGVISMAASFIVGVISFLIAAVVGTTKPSPDVAMFFGFGITILMFVAFAALGAWLLAALSRTALRAVRKEPFDIGEAMNPGGAFGAAILQIGGNILLGAVMYLPIILNLAMGGGLQGPAFPMIIALWALLIIPLIIVWGFGTCLALFAGADEENSAEAISKSFKLTFGNFGVTFLVLLVSGLITAVLAIPTLGLAYIIPIYMTASLYNLANK